MRPDAMTDSAPVEATGGRTPVVRMLRGGEELVANLALAAMVILPLAEIVIRPVLAGGIPGSISFVQHLTLWVGFLGAALAAREGKLIALATATFIPAGRSRHVAEIFAAFVGSAVSAILAAGAYDLVRLDMEDGTTLAVGFPVWIAQLVLPVSFAAIALRLVWRASCWANGCSQLARWGCSSGCISACSWP